MKKLVYAALAFIMCGTALYAESIDDGLYRFELNVGWAGFPVGDALTFTSFNPWSAGETPVSYPGSVGDIYSEYAGPVYSTGILSAELNVRIRKWFAVGAQVNFDGLWSRQYSSETGLKCGVRRGVVFAVLPYARFIYLDRPAVRLYSAVGIGFTAGQIEAGYGRDSYVYASKYPAFQVIPVGVSVGRRIYGLFELGIGTVYTGCRAGIGYRF